MRFEELRLIKYGRFADCTLHFENGGVDLQFIMGRNEAGKSTTLAAVSDLLFGFPHITEQDYQFDKQLLRVGAVIGNGDGRLSCRRRKGTSSTLLDDNERPIDEGRLAAMLGGQTNDSFHRMFSLNHQRLRDGGQAILDAKDDVGQAIFAAGSGMVGISRLSEALEKEAQDIWTKRASDRRSYYVAQRTYEDARARLRATQVKPRKWEDLHKNLQTLDARIVALRAERSQRQADMEGLERRRRVLMPIARLRLAEGALDTLGTVANLPPDAAQIMVDAAKIEAAANVEIRLSTEQAEAARAALSKIAVSPVLLEHRQAVEALSEQVGAIDKSLLDLPKRRAAKQGCQLRLTALLQEIGWPDQPPAEIRARLPGRPKVAELRFLLEEMSGVEATQVAASGQLDTKTEEADSLRRALTTIPPLTDVSPLAAALKLARSFGDVDAAAVEALASHQRALSNVQLGLARLAPWVGDLADLEALALPSEAEAKRLGVALDRAEKELESERAGLQKARERRDRSALERVHMVRDENAIPPERIAAARQTRDRLWTEIRSALLNDLAVDDPARSADWFQEAVVAADELADRRFDAAEQSGRLIEVNARLERDELEIGHADVRATDAAAKLERERANWVAATSVAGDLSPTAFQAWCDRRAQVLENARDLRHLERIRLTAVDRRANVREALRSAMVEIGSSAVSSLKDPPLAMLIGEAERIETKANIDAQAQATLEAQIRTAEEGVRGAQVQLERATAGLAAWTAKWEPAVAAAGLDLAPSPSTVREALNILDQIRSETDEIMRLDERIDGMEADVASFNVRVAELEALCGIDPTGRDASDRLKDLVASAKEATTLTEREAGLCENLEAAEVRLKGGRAQAERAASMLQPLFVAAGARTRAELEQAIERAETSRAKRAEIDKLRDDIVTLGDGLEFDALLAEAERTDVDPAAVKADADALREEVKALNDQIERVGGQHADASAAFKALDDGPNAAVAAADLAQARAEIEFQAEAYVRRRAEASLLRWAIERYRKEKQAPMLLRASSLFSTLTLGRYDSLGVDLDGGKPKLVGVVADGSSVVPVTGMSEGTVDQLYLALRLAAVEDAVAAGLKLPFLADDLFINFDDDRAEAGFRVLAELATKTQVLFLTHHKHLLPIAERALVPAKVTRCDLT